MKHFDMGSLIVIVVTFCLFVATNVEAQEQQPYSPYVGQDFPNNVFFDDTHLHISLSVDSYGDDNTTKGPEDAYRFAKGEEMDGHDGVPVGMSRPLDFIVIADHGEYMGVVQGVSAANKEAA